MLFHSFEFMLLLVFTYALYYMLPSKRAYILAAANLLFYGASGIGFLVLFIIMSYITYFCSRKLHGRYGKAYYLSVLAVNILNIAFFKYTGFILINLNKLLGAKFVWQDNLLARIILPVGISFYTFQLIAYIVDVKRGDIEPCESYVRFWVFISFFAQLIAGPIMRGRNFIPQLDEVDSISFEEVRFKYGIYYIFRGLIKKIIFADNLAPIVIHYYSDVAAMSGLDAWFATYVFAFQIYFDFSAYSEFAIGIGHLFGFDMACNFKTPYISGNPKDFWRRWHITLSSWIRDYIYIPLGGNTNILMRKSIFVLAAMLISGLWHGAKWTFVLWGAYHGLLAALHNYYKKYSERLAPKLRESLPYRYICTFVFFQLATMGWVLFRANSLHDAAAVLLKMLNFTDFVFYETYYLYFSVIAVLYLLHLLEYYINKHEAVLCSRWTQEVPPYIRAAVYTALIFVLIMFNASEESTFIYFQF
ncbi:MAG: MBOAT family O-acyltransferase [Bacillota bacterium]